MLKTCWPWHAEEPNMAKQLGESSFTSRFGTYCISICCFFRLEASTKKLFVSFNLPCFVLFFCLSRCCGSSGKYCKHSVYMIISRELERRELEKRELERRELERERERVRERELDRERVGERHRQSCWSEQQTELFPGRLSPICILVLWFNDFCYEWNYKIAVASLSIHQFSIFLRNSLLVSSDFWHVGNFIFDEIWPKRVQIGPKIFLGSFEKFIKNLSFSLEII